MILINGRTVRGNASKTNAGLFLKLILQDWDWTRLEKGDTATIVAEEKEGLFTINSTIRCPGGEPEAWILLREISRAKSSIR